MTDNEILMSPTLTMLVEMSVGIPLDVKNQDDLKYVFRELVLEMAQAMDERRILCADEEIFSATLGLMAIALDVSLDGRLSQCHTPMMAH